MRIRIRLDKFSDAVAFTRIAEKHNSRIVITDNNGFCVNAKSLLGALHAMEFEELWCQSTEDIHTEIRDFLYE